MTIWREILGTILCLAPLLAVVALLIWASRRPKCPHCNYAISAKDTSTCHRCGQPLKPAP